MKIKSLILILGILLPTFLVFRQFFLPGPLAWGDAPHFVPAEAEELLREPQAWSSNGNALGGVNNFLWIWPITLLYGLLAFTAGLGNDLTIRIIFYFPAVILAAVGSWAFARREKLTKKGAFWVSLVYTLNTYFILLIDGGVVGFALAYGFFPLAFLFLRQGKLASAIPALFLQTIFDPRSAAILLFAYAALSVFEKRLDLKFFLLLVISNLLLNSYWIVPLISAGETALPDAGSLRAGSILSALSLFQPHWPGNVFGEVSPPPFYFALTPFLFAPALFSKEKRSKAYFAVFLISAFLVGAGTGAFHQIPFGAAFRDSSKFFMPLMLFAGLLIGKSKPHILTYVFLIILVLPALRGELNFVLSGRVERNSFDKPREAFRTAWFPDTHPVSFHTSKNQAVGAKELANFRPLGRLNAGSFDRFNYFQDEAFLDWYSLYGVGELVYAGDARKAGPSDKEQALARELREKVASASAKLREPKPQLFAVDKLIAVVGGDDVYEEVSDPASRVFAFFEDGMWDPRSLEGAASSSAKIIFNNAEDKDLRMSLLQKFFVPASSAGVSEWALRAGEDYLRYKYELLLSDYDFGGFDYSRGIAFSTVPDEEIFFDLRAPREGSYILAVRVASSGSGVKIRFAGTEDSFASRNFAWFTKGVTMEEGGHELKVTNIGGTSVLNVAALVPAADWNEAGELAETFKKHFGTVERDDIASQESGWNSIEFEKTGETGYEFDPGQLKNPGWIVLADKYNPSWRLRKGVKFFSPVAAYSSVNAFYAEPNWRDTSVEFALQKSFRWGTYVSAISGLFLGIVYLWKNS